MSPWSLAAVANDQKWAPPPVVGMPGHHPRTTINAPEPKSQIDSWRAIAGDWKQLSGKVKEKWGQLTDDAIAKLEGKREQLEGMPRARYGYTKARADQEINAWMAKH